MSKCVPLFFLFTFFYSLVWFLLLQLLVVVLSCFDLSSILFVLILRCDFLFPLISFSLYLASSSRLGLCCPLKCCVLACMWASIWFAVCSFYSFYSDFVSPQKCHFIFSFLICENDDSLFNIHSNFLGVEHDANGWACVCVWKQIASNRMNKRVSRYSDSVNNKIQYIVDDVFFFTVHFRDVSIILHSPPHLCASVRAIVVAVVDMCVYVCVSLSQE